MKLIWNSFEYFFNKVLNHFAKKIFEIDSYKSGSCCCRMSEKRKNTVLEIAVLSYYTL